MKIYTKKGDSGYSDILKKRVKKSDIIFDITGSMDKLLSCLNFVRIDTENDDIQTEILNLQKDLIKLNGYIAGYTEFSCDVSFFEERIDFYMSKAGAFKEFTLAKTKSGAQLDFARCVCRECERYAVKTDYIDEKVLKYLNRMSDYLYALSKYVDM